MTLKQLAEKIYKMGESTYTCDLIDQYISYNIKEKYYEIMSGSKDKTNGIDVFKVGHNYHKGIYKHLELKQPRILALLLFAEIKEEFENE